MDLIKHLDLKKDEAIERTFKTIAKHFSEVFAELVPGGKATLVIETKKVRGASTHAHDVQLASQTRAHARMSSLFFLSPAGRCRRR